MDYERYKRVGEVSTTRLQGRAEMRSDTYTCQDMSSDLTSNFSTYKNYGSYIHRNNSLLKYFKRKKIKSKKQTGINVFEKHFKIF